MSMMNWRTFARVTKYLTRQTPLTLTRRCYADGHDMSFTFASQSQVFYNQSNVRQVDVPSFSGNFGILPAHVPSLAVIKPGVVTVFEADGTPKKFFVSSGTVTINDDSSVQILAEEAANIDDIDLASARDILSKTTHEVSSATNEEDRATAMIAQEVAEALVKAAESG